MGMLESIIGSLTGGGTSSGMGGVLANLLGGQQSGGIGGLLSSFQQAGLGHVAQSWINNGPNRSVTPSELSRVFGEDRVNTMAEQAGMEPRGFLAQLAEHLPNAVDRLTPNGQVTEQTVSV